MVLLPIVGSVGTPTAGEARDSYLRIPNKTDRNRVGYLSKTPEQIRAAGARHRARHPEQNRNYIFKTKYGITEDDYARMFRSQDGRCAICGTDKPLGKGRRLHVDHDHESGVVRGLLCGKCNTALGLLNDDPGMMERAAKYLRAGRELGDVHQEAG